MLVQFYLAISPVWTQLAQKALISYYEPQMQRLVSIYRPVLDDTWLEHARQLAATDFAADLSLEPDPRVLLLGTYHIRQLPNFDTEDSERLVALLNAGQAQDVTTVPATKYLVKNRGLTLGLEENNPVLDADRSNIVRAINRIGQLAMANTPFRYNARVGTITGNGNELFQRIVRRFNTPDAGALPSTARFGRLAVAFKDNKTGAVVEYTV